MNYNVSTKEMNLTIDKNKLKMAPLAVGRELGYAFFRDPKSGEESFVRRPYGSFYPRFHLYIETRGNQAVFNLHLDQKQASYPGAHKHNADYDGDAVATEMERIKKVILTISSN